jgi:GTP-dependent phosphoenolpyruvate carboxykinase
MEAIGEYLESFGDRTPRALLEEQQRIKAELDAIDWPR